MNTGVYVLAHDGKLKIGYSDWLYSRLSQHRSNLKGHALLGTIQGARTDEPRIHRLLTGRVLGKVDWFADTPENRAVLATEGLTMNVPHWRHFTEVEPRQGALTCLRCDYRWNAKATRPKSCPHCKSRQYDAPLNPRYRSTVRKIEVA